MMTTLTMKKAREGMQIKCRASEERTLKKNGSVWGWKTPDGRWYPMRDWSAWEIVESELDKSAGELLIEAKAHIASMKDHGMSDPQFAVMLLLEECVGKVMAIAGIAEVEVESV